MLRGVILGKWIGGERKHLTNQRQLEQRWAQEELMEEAAEGEKTRKR